MQKEYIVFQFIINHPNTEHKNMINNTPERKKKPIKFRDINTKTLK